MGEEAVLFHVFTLCVHSSLSHITIKATLCNPNHSFPLIITGDDFQLLATSIINQSFHTYSLFLKKTSLWGATSQRAASRLSWHYLHPSPFGPLLITIFKALFLCYTLTINNLHARTQKSQTADNLQSQTSSQYNNVPEQNLILDGFWILDDITQCNGNVYSHFS